jgi:phosphoribosylglycinamide formyltransferase 1
MTRRRVAVLISGSGSNLQALMDAASAADYPAQIVLVISNKAEAYGLTRAQAANIPTRTINYKEFATREAFDAAMHAELQAHDVEIVCLAGFMRLLSPWFVQQWRGRMLNIHPSLLPLFKGAHAVRDALAAGATESGCTVHLVTEEMDEGEVIGQARVAILPGEDEAAVHQKIHAQEHVLYPNALKKLVESL